MKGFLAVGDNTLATKIKIFDSLTCSDKVCWHLKIYVYPNTSNLTLHVGIKHKGPE